MNQQYGKRNRALWTTQAVLAYYQAITSSTWESDGVELARLQAACGEGVGIDDGIHRAEWRSEVNERREVTRVFTSERGYW